MHIVLDTDVISIMTHSMATSLLISFHVSRKISHLQGWIFIAYLWRHDMENFS